MLRIRAIAAVLAAAVALTACGGGGDPPPEPTAPGVLRAVAIQGAAAVGAPGATYTLLPLFPVMDTHRSGWSAFAAPTTDVVKTSVLNAMGPGGAVIHVLAVGDKAPGLPDADITGFSGVWVGSGLLFAYVTLSDNVGTRTFGIVSAQLSEGAGASNFVGVLYEQDSTAASGVADTVASIDAVTPTLTNGGTLWFLAGLGGGDTDLFSIAADATALTARAKVGDAVGPGGSIVSIDAFAVEPTSNFFSLVADVTAGDRRIYVKNAAGAMFSEVMEEGEAVPGTGGVDVVVDIHAGGTLSVYETGRVAWLAEVAGGARWYLVGDAGAVVPLARTGDPAQFSAGGVFSTLTGLNQRSPARIPQFRANVTGSSNGVTIGTYGIPGVPPAVVATDNLSNTTAGTMGATYLGLAPARAYREVSENGSFLFANVLQSGLSAVLWLIPGDRIYHLAVQGEATPQGDTFASLGGTSAHTVENGSALFRVNLAGAGSGIFRRGP